MKKTRELIAENLKAVDVVIEVIDSRIPRSSRNPIIDELVARKPRIIILNKSDLSDTKENAKWEKHFKENGSEVLAMDCAKGAGVKELYKLLDELQKKRDEGQIRHRPLKLMIVGVPNVGKSSLINRMTGRRAAKTGDRPGVTKGKQWLALENGMQLLDTPGILWPKFEDPKVGLNLAFCGSIKDEILDTASLALELIKSLYEKYPAYLMGRYKITEEDFINEYEEFDALAGMEAICKKRGFILPGKKLDYDRCAITLLDEFRGGVIGNITLEKVDD